MRKLTVVFYLLIFCGVAKAQSYLNVLNTNDITTQYNLYNTEITFSEDGDMIVTEKDMAPVQFLFAEVVEMTISNSVVNVKEIMRNNQLSFYVKEDYLYILDTHEILKQQIIIFDILGKVRIVSDSERVTKINISSLAKGVYLVKAGVSTFKFLK